MKKLIACFGFFVALTSGAAVIQGAPNGPVLGLTSVNLDQLKQRALVSFRAAGMTFSAAELAQTHVFFQEYYVYQQDDMKDPNQHIFKDGSRFVVIAGNAKSTDHIQTSYVLYVNGKSELAMVDLKSNPQEVVDDVSFIEADPIPGTKDVEIQNFIQSVKSKYPSLYVISDRGPQALITIGTKNPADASLFCAAEIEFKKVPLFKISEFNYRYYLEMPLASAMVDVSARGGVVDVASLRQMKLDPSIEIRP